MHPRIFREFESLVGRLKPTGPVLEVGATPTADTLLNLPSLASNRSRVGVNLDGPHQCDGFEIMRGDGNAMTFFGDGQFELVVCNAMLEHDRCFWKTIAEMQRVTRPGGTMIIGVPGFAAHWLERWTIKLRRLGGPFESLALSSPTFIVHYAPDDFYRFSTSAMKKVFFESFEQVEVRALMIPPRIVGTGVKPRQ